MKGYDFYFFDLFHTLVLLEPNPEPEENEYAILGISRSEWTKATLQDYEERATGKLSTPEEVVAFILSRAGIVAETGLRERVLDARRRRYRRTFSSIRPSILKTLTALRSRGQTLVLVSNADAFDSLYWSESPLAPLFSAAIFSWEVGCMKPDRRIYELAMERVGADPERSVFIGDGGHSELQGAKAAGLDAILTTELIMDFWPEAIPKLAASADYVVENLTELVAGEKIQFC